jgi:hypothetical protein
MKKKQHRMRFFALLIGVLCSYVAQAQISMDEYFSSYRNLGKYESDDQKQIYVDSDDIDIDKTYEMASQKVKDDIEKLKAVDVELKNMMANLGNCVQNETQHLLLNQIAKSYTEKMYFGESTLPRFSGGDSNIIVRRTKVEKDASKGIINKKLIDEIKKQDEVIIQKIEEDSSKLADIRKYNFFQLGITDHFPLKKIKVARANPYYRPNHAFDQKFLDYIDVIQQTAGWEWVNEETGVEKTENYPYDVHYRFYKSHPQYRLDDGDVYNNTGQLVRVNDFLRTQVQNIEKNLISLLCIQDFKNDKYSIKKEGNAVNLAVKYELGILKKPSTKAQNVAAKSMVRAMWNRSGARASGSYWAEQRAKKAEEIALLKTMSAFKMSPAEMKASHYVSQLEHDYEGKFNNIYKIERLDNTSFKIIYIDDNGVNFCTAKVTFVNTDRYASAYELSLLPNGVKLDISPKIQK